MEMKESGYRMKSHATPVKRYCQTLQLKNDPELIREYIRRHTPENRWPEIPEGIRAVGILDMEIYLLGNTLFMIVETPLDFEWDTAMARLAELPRQAEWEAYMSIFQEADSNATSAEKWQLMERIFSL